MRLYSTAMWVQTCVVSRTQVLLHFRATANALHSPFVVSSLSSELINLLPNCRYSGEPAGLTSFERAAAGMQMHICCPDNAFYVTHELQLLMTIASIHVNGEWAASLLAAHVNSPNCRLCDCPCELKRLLNASLEFCSGALWQPL